MTSHTNSARRNAANLAALRCGVPAHQSGIDAFWADLAEKLNATLPTRASSRLASTEALSERPARPSQAEADSMWADIAGRNNAEAGLAAPARSRA